MAGGGVPPTGPVPPTGTVTLTDPRAARALAHPARLIVIDALYSGEILTATQCAALAGISPSAMSYHLRALEKYGIVRRADPVDDGRQRPWMRAGDDLRTELREAGVGAAAATELLVDQSMSLDRRRLREAVNADLAAGPDGPWRGTTTYARSRLLLTAQEARALHERLDEVTAKFLLERRRDTPPPGSATFDFAYLLVREDPQARSG